MVGLALVSAMAVFGASLVGLFGALPPALLATVAGTALLGSMASAMGSALGADQDRLAAAATLAVTASGVTLLGIGSAFWGLCLGLLVLNIDRLARKVERGGVAIDLSPKEYAFLEYMALRAGELVTRDDLSEHVWDEDYNVFTNLVEVYILRLRRKIDSGRAVKLIRTRRGEGYMISGDPRA